jgi:hypothetical protein
MRTVLNIKGKDPTGLNRSISKVRNNCENNHDDITIFSEYETFRKKKHMFVHCEWCQIWFTVPATWYKRIKE